MLSASSSFGAPAETSADAAAGATPPAEPSTPLTPGGSKVVRAMNTAGTESLRRISFKLLVGGIAFLFSACVLLVILFVELSNFEITREKLLSDAVKGAAARAAGKIEEYLNISFTNVVSSGTAARMLSNTLHSGVATEGPWRNSGGGGVWTVEPIVQRSFERQMTYLMERQRLHPFKLQQELLVSRWRDGTASVRNADFAAQTARAALYRSKLNNGFWTGSSVVDLPSDNITTGWNMATEKVTSAPFPTVSTRTTVYGEFWNSSIAVALGNRNSATPGQVPVYTKQPWIEGLFFTVQHMTFQNAGDPATKFPFLLSLTGLSLTDFGALLHNNLVVDPDDPELSSRSRSFLVARRLGVVFSQSAPEPTFIRRNFTPGVTHLDDQCYPFPPAGIMGCFKNVSDAPDFALIRALLGTVPPAALATKSGIPTPMLSNPDIPGDIVCSVVTDSDGIEYFVVAETLRLDSGADLYPTLVIFTPKNLFSRRQLRARDVAIGVAVALFVVIMLVLQLLLYFIGAAVSDLTDEMANPLESHILRRSETAADEQQEKEGGEGSPQQLMERKAKIVRDDNEQESAAPAVSVVASASERRSKSSDASSFAKSWAASLKRQLTSSLEELVMVRDEFNFCIERIKELRGFMDTNACRLLAKKPVLTISPDDSLLKADCSSDFAESSSTLPCAASRSTSRNNSSSGGYHPNSLISEANKKNDFDDSFGSVTSSNRRRVRFSDDAQVVLPAVEGQDDDDNNASSDDKGTSTLRKVPRRRQESQHRFCCIAVSFPFISKLALRLRKLYSASPMALMSDSSAGVIDPLPQIVSDDLSALHQLLFDAVAAAAHAAHDIVSQAHATSINEFSSVGDEVLCCFRLRSTFKRSRIIINALQECVGAAYSLKRTFAALQQQQQSDAVVPVEASGGIAKTSAPVRRLAADNASAKAIAAAVATLSARDQFVTVGVASTRAYSVTQRSDDDGDDENAESAPARQRPVTIIGEVVPHSHAVLRCMQRSAGGLIYDHDECNLLLRDSPRMRWRNKRTIYAVPFAIGIARDLVPLVEPEFTAVESVSSPERWARHRELQERQQLRTGNDGDEFLEDVDDHRLDLFCRLRKWRSYAPSVEILRLAPVEVALPSLSRQVSSPSS